MSLDNTPYSGYLSVCGQRSHFLGGQRVTASSFCVSWETFTFFSCALCRRHSMNSTLTSACLDPSNDHDACPKRKDPRHLGQVIISNRFMERGGGQGGPGGAWVPQIFRTTKTSAFSTNAQSRFVPVVLDSLLRPPCLAQHT